MRTTLVLKTTFVSCFVDNPQHFCGPSEAACTLGIFWWFSLSSQAAVQLFLGPEKLVRQKKKNYCDFTIEMTVIVLTLLKEWQIQKKSSDMGEFATAYLKQNSYNRWSVQQ